MTAGAGETEDFPWGLLSESRIIRSFLSENLEIISDSVKAFKVARTIKNRLGGQVYEAVCYAAASVHPERERQFLFASQSAGKGRIDTRVLELLAAHFQYRFP